MAAVDRFSFGQLLNFLNETYQTPPHTPQESDSANGSLTTSTEELLSSKDASSDTTISSSSSVIGSSDEEDDGKGDDSDDRKSNGGDSSSRGLCVTKVTSNWSDELDSDGYESEVKRINESASPTISTSSSEILSNEKSSSPVPDEFITPPAQIRGRSFNPYSTPFVPKWSNSLEDISPIQSVQPIIYFPTPPLLQPAEQGMPIFHYDPNPPTPHQQYDPFALHYCIDPPVIYNPLPLVFVGLQDLPYVSNVIDEITLHAMKPQSKYTYYVPPRVSDYDFFGGQIRVWQEKVMQSFGRFLPDLWVIQGVHDIVRCGEYGWGYFSITCKLRFCCRTCVRPWTSMRGKIHFSFTFDPIFWKGIVLMKIFGQVCNQDNCQDQSFQTPACYPEEIERVVQKLANYVGFSMYNIPLPIEFFTEPDKAIRVGNPKSPHRPDLCQACSQGICSRI